MPNSMSASLLLGALAEKHKGDVFVPECKNGPTQTGSHRRLDAWVLLKTWSPVTTIGYEIKVDRADWRRDEKIAEYQGLCHALYVVAPKGVVPLDELPAGVGLLEPAGPHDRLLTKRRASRNEIEMPVSLLVYVLMCRSTIQREAIVQMRERDATWRADNLRKWVEDKDERRRLSYAVSEKIRRQFELQESEISRVTDRIARLEQIEQRIIELGFDPNRNVNAWEVGRRVEELDKFIPSHVPAQLDSVITALQRVRERFDACGRAAPGRSQ